MKKREEHNNIFEHKMYWQNSDRKRERERESNKQASNVHGTIDIIYSCKMLAERG